MVKKKSEKKTEKKKSTRKTRLYASNGDMWTKRILPLEKTIQPHLSKIADILSGIEVLDACEFVRNELMFAMAFPGLYGRKFTDDT